jgi:tripartite-type tricarboxylate transporter receptor subunit TctC
VAQPAKPAPTLAPTAPPAQAAPKPASTPAPAKLDTKAAEDFYRNKTIRVVTGYGAGGPFDIFSRLVAKHMGQFIPGKPSMIVENKPGAGSILAANLVYTTEPKDGTVIANFGPNLPLQQVLGKDGIQFDWTKFQWLGSGAKTVGACAARNDAGVKAAADLQGADARQLIVGSIGPGGSNYDLPAVLAPALGLNLKIVSGYESTAKIGLALQSNEVNGYCANLDSMTSSIPQLYEGSQPLMKVFLVTGSQVPSHAWLKSGVQAAEPLATTDETRQMLQAVDIPAKANLPFAVAPGVPAERVEALRKAMADTFASAEFRADGQKAGFEIAPNNADELTAVYGQIQKVSPPVLAKLREILK